MPRLVDGIAHSECPTCGWPEAKAHFVHAEDEGLVVGIWMTCVVCNTSWYIEHE